MEINNRGIQIFNNSFNTDEDKNRSERIYKYFREIWQRKADYKVFMARRSFNLNYILMVLYDAESSFDVSNVISNNALLLKVNEITNYYLENNCFPNILICDDIMLHGRGICTFINSLGDAILEYSNTIGVSFDEQSLKDQLINSIQIKVFTLYDDGIIIDRHRYHIDEFEHSSITKIRGLSQQISTYLMNCGIANTSYVVSGFFSSDFQKIIFNNEVTKNPDLTFCYRGRQQVIYYRNKGKIFETIRIRYPNSNKKNMAILTSLDFFNEIKKSDFDLLCTRIADELNEYGFEGRIVDILRCNLKSLDIQKMQLLSFLFSAVTFADFYKLMFDLDHVKIFGLLMATDYDKIITNFDFGFKIKKEVEKLFFIVSNFEKFRSDIFAFIPNVNDKLINENRSVDFVLASFKGNKEAYLRAEDVFYDLGYEAEKQANDYKQSDSFYDPKDQTKDVKTVEEYLESLRNQKGDNSLTDILVSLGLVDSGLGSMNEYSYINNETKDYYLSTSFKAGELSNSVYARRFSIFIPALAFIETRFKMISLSAMKNGFQTIKVKDVLSDFIDDLQNHCFSKYNRVKNIDRLLLELLKENKSKLLKILDMGHSFNDWNINLVTKDEVYFGVGNKSEFHFTEEEERERKNYYLEYAKTY